MSEQLSAEWAALLASRRKHNSSGQDGSDFAVWFQWRTKDAGTQQLEIVAAHPGPREGVDT